MFSPETRILIVDDMSVMRRLMVTLLTRMGFTRVVEATDGSDAWQKFVAAEKEAAPFQLVVSDWNMPRMKGIDLLRKIRQNPASAQLPFVMVTAENDSASVTESASAGVTCHLAKPFAEEQLKTALQEAFEKTQKSSVAS